ncbi:MAG: M3 family metallopeptidase [bacterium]
MHSPTQSDAHGQNLQADQSVWDLSVLYAGPDDPKIDADLDAGRKLAEAMSARHRGKLDTNLDQAIADLIAVTAKLDLPLVFLSLLLTKDTGNQAVKKRLAAVQEEIARISGEHLTFIEVEIAGLEESAIERQSSGNSVRHHLPWLNKIRLFRDHMLSEPVERALAKREPFGPSSWSLFYDEVEADLRVTLPDEEITLTVALHRLSEERDAAVRASLLEAVHLALGGFFLKYSTETLMNTVRSKALEDSERSYSRPMAARNLSNRLDDATVEALHQAVAERAAPAAQRYYRLKATLLGLDRLAWSDRSAPLPFRSEALIPFTDARRMVEEAYASFSPTLAGLVRNQLSGGRVDAPHHHGKQGGAFNLSLCLPDGRPASFTLLNYLGSPRDVATLAHELGHGVHGLLAGEAQGPLMQHAPMAYAETASIFGEMVTFRFLLDRHRAAGEDRAALALLMEKCEDFINSVVRQVGFSNFERRLHGAPGRLTPDELNQLWLQTTQELYGLDGDVFTYQNAERLWSYVSHFHRPFYVYAYAVGELVTRTLFGLKDDLGDRFEPLYLDLLRAGGTKPLTELLKPFGQDPTDPHFWTKGIETFERQVEEAERLSAAI